MHRLPIFLLVIGALWFSTTHAQQTAPPTAAPVAAPGATAPTSAAPTAPVTDTATAPAPTGPVTFPQGVEYFKKNDFAHSREVFTQLLAEHPQDPTLLYNAGLVEVSDKHPGRALAYWRKALYLEPGFAPVLAGMAHLKKAKLLPPEEEPNPFAWLYWRIPLSYLLAISFLLFIATGILWIRFALQKKMEKPAPLGALITAAILFFVMMGFSVHDYQLNHFETKATIMEPTVAAFASPSADAPSLFEFREGDEVTIRRTQQDWLQVQKSATAVGWVKKNQILIHSGT